MVIETGGNDFFVLQVFTEVLAASQTQDQYTADRRYRKVLKLQTKEKLRDART
jgi:hypothetical protein